MRDAVQTPALRRWTREEFDQMIAAGVIHSGERVELVDGEIWTMAAHGSAHAAAVQATQKTLEAAFGRDYLVRVQMPIALDDRSAPEPDLTVVPGTLEDY